jgi:hypothetical protein
MEYRTTVDGHRLDDKSAACEKCGFWRPPMPAWFTAFGTRFRFVGRIWTVVGLGSTNRYTPGNAHFEDYIIAERDTSWRSTFTRRDLYMNTRGGEHTPCRPI